MGIIGSAIGAGMKTIGAIAGGIIKSKAAKKARQATEKQRQKNQDWYDRRYNEDATQRADAQAMLSYTQDQLRKQNRRAAGTAAVMGGTTESIAAQKAAGNQLLGNVTSNIAAQAGQRKDNIEATYMSNDDTYNRDLIGIQNQKAAAVNDAVQGVSDAANDVAQALPW